MAAGSRPLLESDPLISRGAFDMKKRPKGAEKDVCSIPRNGRCNWLQEISLQVQVSAEAVSFMYWCVL